MENNDISKEISAVRKKLGFTLKEMGEKLGMNMFTFANYEHGRSMPPADVYLRIVNLLDSEEPST